MIPAARHAPLFDVFKIRPLKMRQNKENQNKPGHVIRLVGEGRVVAVRGRRPVSLSLHFDFSESNCSVVVFQH